MERLNVDSGINYNERSLEKMIERVFAEMLTIGIIDNARVKPDEIEVAYYDRYWPIKSM